MNNREQFNISPKMTTAEDNGNVSDGIGCKSVQDVHLEGGLTLTYETFYRQLQQQQQQQQRGSSSSLLSASHTPAARRTSPAICYVIVSASSMLWTVVTIVSAALIVFAILTPRWLISGVGVAPAASRAAFAVSISSLSTTTAPPPPPPASSAAAASRDSLDGVEHLNRRPLNASADIRVPSAANRANAEAAAPVQLRTSSIGIFNECLDPGIDVRQGDPEEKVGFRLDANAVLELLMLRSPNCDTFVTGFDMPDELFPDAWKSATALLIIAGTLLTFTSVTAVVSVCVQSLFGKSIFTVSGLLQSIAGKWNSICVNDKQNSSLFTVILRGTV